MPRTNTRRNPYSLNKDFTSKKSRADYRSPLNLKGWWRLDKSLATDNAVDSSGNGRTGVFDTSSHRPALAAGVTPSTHIQGSSNAFNGSTHAINIGTASTWNAIIGTDAANGATAEMTFSAWINPVSLGGSSAGTVLSFGLDQISLQKSLSGGAITMVFNAGYSSTAGAWRANVKIFAGVWTHVAVVYKHKHSSNDPVFYVNGEPVEVIEIATPSGSPSGISSKDCIIGNNYNNTRDFDGNLADVAVWNKLLNSEEIKAIYEAEHGILNNTSGILNLPPRIEIRNRDNTTGEVQHLF
jgi:hypothetical protein